MRTWFSEDHRLHFPQGELSGGELVTPFERPSRVEYVLRRLAECGFDAPQPPGEPDMAPLRVLHAPDYLDFLASAWDAWVAAGLRGEAIAGSYPARRMQTARPPRNIEGKVGHYALASETAITAGTWRAALSSAASAQAAARDVAGGARGAFALCRPPGHHASRDQFGG
jgi:acetoin utilization deacetylase AcuC-like enzyme